MFRALKRAVQLSVSVGLLLVATVPGANAATEAFGPQVCQSGSGAGQCLNILSAAASSVNGHYYASDRGNNRISEFTAWGEFVKAWGWGVRDGAPELQTCTIATGCQASPEGLGVGQFLGNNGITVDSSGDIYVADRLASRIQKFDPDGDFLLMLGDGVNQGPVNPGDVCTAANLEEGDTCGAGAAGSGDGQFLSTWPPFGNLGTGAADQLYVGDKGRVQEFDSGGHFVRVLPDPDEVLRNGTASEDLPIESLAVDPVSGNIYLAAPGVDRKSVPPDPGVFRIDPSSGELLDTLDVERPTAISVDDDGNVYVFDNGRFTGASNDPLNRSTSVFKFDSAGTLLEKIAEVEFLDPAEFGPSGRVATSAACSASGDGASLYVVSGNKPPFIQAYGSTPDPTKCLPPAVPPEIVDQFPASVGTTSASLEAKINPHYFTAPVGTTTYYLQWASAQCIEEGGWEAGCVQEKPSPPGSELESPPVDEGLAVIVELEGLDPATAYRFRFVAEGTGEPGAVIGEGGKPGLEGSAGAFATQPAESTLPACANDSYRTGPGAQLRDCRAYELVSPLDKAGGDVQARLNLVPFEARADQASLSGDEFAFSAYRAFEDPASAPFSSQYLSRRQAGSGWETEALSPPQEGEGFVNPLLAVDNLFRAFSADLSQAWLYTFTEPVLGSPPSGVAGEPNVYRRDNQSATYEACTTSPALSDQTETHGPQLQGFSADGSLAVFKIEGKLTANGSNATKGDGRPINQVYACSYTGEGPASLRLVSTLPNGEASDLENTAGGPANAVFQFDQGRITSLYDALAGDGSQVFWMASTGVDAQNPGTLYLRLNPGAEPTASGECSGGEADKACTVQVSAGPARFHGAALDGSVAIFSEAGELREYEVASAETHPIASESLGVLGISEDASRVYFLSAAELDGGAIPGEPNLYLYERGAGSSFIATLSEMDAIEDVSEGANGVLSPANAEPVRHTARVSPDGATVAFMSNSASLAAEVAGYDNTDQLTGLPAAEIYRYRAGGEVACVSCNRSGARPTGREIQPLGALTTLPAASLLPPWLNSLYAPKVLSEDGNRIFFEAFEALVPEDTNDKADVYQWEALGKGSCEESDPGFDPQSEGCVSLLSSGKSTTDSEFVDASPSGDDVFIRTASSLVAWDPGAIDIYDARVGGGLPAPPAPPDPEEECKGEACAPPPTPPPPPPVLQSTTPSAGNVPTVRKCPKGKRKVKRKGKVRCVAKHHKKSHNKHHRDKNKAKKKNKGKANKGGRASR